MLLLLLFFLSPFLSSLSLTCNCVLFCLYWRNRCYNCCFRRCLCDDKKCTKSLAFILLIPSILLKSKSSLDSGVIANEMNSQTDLPITVYFLHPTCNGSRKHSPKWKIRSKTLQCQVFQWLCSWSQLRWTTTVRLLVDKQGKWRKLGIHKPKPKTKTIIYSFVWFYLFVVIFAKLFKFCYVSSLMDGKRG